jgi:hypothetical protein
VGVIIALRLASEGDPTRCPCCIISCGDHACGDETEIEARGLYLAPYGPGEAPAGMPGLCEADVTNWPGNGNPGIAWLLDAEEVGTGGENGSGGYCAIDACLLIVDAGEIEAGGGSSSPNETPRARSFASFNSSTYLFHAAGAVSIGGGTGQTKNLPFKSGRSTVQSPCFRCLTRSSGSGQAPLLCDCSRGSTAATGSYKSKPSML